MPFGILSGSMHDASEKRRVRLAACSNASSHFSGQISYGFAYTNCFIDAFPAFICSRMSGRRRTLYRTLRIFCV
ncbi:hypothetical protein ATCV1_z741L [Acanthocystis turfacea chlorella virus 1]|uniref:Uncharacterized protein z741L n=1 Tax=Chlorovirus heliozoae TaxID=322019 RepID=A7KA01_9PHYC|nr:hypothetical protein ATCV1_z741L [Acanthocystis turfacea chlorella virus 1]ABT16875.1 hypothetical protein ATCV1_z741L [Acanthocystis turfacea chlorella virus 1]